AAGGEAEAAGRDPPPRVPRSLLPAGFLGGLHGGARADEADLRVGAVAERLVGRAAAAAERVAARLGRLDAVAEMVEERNVPFHAVRAVLADRDLRFAHGASSRCAGVEAVSTPAHRSGSARTRSGAPGVGREPRAARGTS